MDLGVLLISMARNTENPRFSFNNGYSSINSMIFVNLWVSIISAALTGKFGFNFVIRISVQNVFYIRSRVDIGILLILKVLTRKI